MKDRRQGTLDPDMPMPCSCLGRPPERRTVDSARRKLPHDCPCDVTGQRPEAPQRLRPTEGSPLVVEPTTDLQEGGGAAERVLSKPSRGRRSDTYRDACGG